MITFSFPMRNYRYGQVPLSTSIKSWTQAPPPPLTDTIFISPNYGKYQLKIQVHVCLPALSLLIYMHVLEGVVESMWSCLQFSANGITHIFAVVRLCCPWKPWCCDSVGRWKQVLGIVLVLTVSQAKASSTTLCFQPSG